MRLVERGIEWATACAATRAPVQALFDYIEGGDTVEDFLEGFPTVSREFALQALEEAKQLLLARA